MISTHQTKKDFCQVCNCKNCIKVAHEVSIKVGFMD